MKAGGDRLWVSTLPTLHRLKTRPQLVDRMPWLESRAKSKSVVHLGFVDVGRIDDKTSSGTWLHERLARAAEHIVGIDLDESGVAQAREAGYDAYVCNLESAEAVASLGVAPAELLIAGELIEHLDCPGRFLDAIKPLVTERGALVLTTPNAVSLTNFLMALSRREWASPPHVVMYSWRTLASLLELHGWQLRELLFYRRGQRSGPEAAGHPRMAAAFNTYEWATRPLLRRLPLIADGLIAVAGLTDEVVATPTASEMPNLPPRPPT